MRTIITFLAILFFYGTVFSQCPGPAQRTALINLQKSTTVEGTKAGQIPLTDACGNERYAQYVEINPTVIAYTPTTTGNSQNISEFVTTASGDIWYIDWQGRGIKIFTNGSGTADYDWLEIGNNGIPNNIKDSIYTSKYAAVNMRYVWPGAQFLVGDSTATGNSVVFGDRNARTSYFRKTDGSWSSIGQEGGTSTVNLGPGTSGFSIQTAAGTNPAAPFAPFRSIASFNRDSTVQLNDYKSSRRDTQVVNNILYTDGNGVVRSASPSAVGGGGRDSTFAKTSGSYSNKRISDNIYKYGTLSIRTIDTTGVLTLSQNGSLKPLIQATGNAGLILNVPPDTRTTGGLIQNFAIANSFYPSASSSGDNAVIHYGFNLDGGGSIKDPTKSAMWFSMENSFNNPGNYRAYEVQFPQVLYPSGAARRPITMYLSNNEATAIKGSIAFCSDNFVIKDYQSNSNKVIWGFSNSGTSPYPKSLEFIDTMPIRWDKNNTQMLLGRNAANTSYVDVMRVDAADKIFFGGGGESGLKLYNDVQISNSGNVWNESGMLNFGKTGSEVLSIFSSSIPSVVRLKSTGASRYVDLSLSGTDMYWQSSSGFVPMFLSLSAPSYGICLNSSGNFSTGSYNFPARMNIWNTSAGASSPLVHLGNSVSDREIFVSNSTPEGAITGSPGDIALSGNGNLYVKKTGAATNTGWQDISSANTGETAISSITLTSATITDLATITLPTPGTYVVRYDVSAANVSVASTRSELDVWITNASNTVTANAATKINFPVAASDTYATTAGQQSLIITTTTNEQYKLRGAMVAGSMLIDNSGGAIRNSKITWFKL